MTAEQGGVGLVVVSHSRPLARAAVALAQQMVKGRPVRFAIAAGLDETTLGTDAVRISEAIEEVDGPAGVVVLMDLGSAVLSAELALDLLTDHQMRTRVVLSPAPLVEGLVVAAVAAAGGGTAADVAAEARTALMGKAAQLSDGQDNDAATALPDSDGEGLSAVFTVENPHGLHARPAARLVGEVRGLDATVRLRNVTTGAGPVPATSLSRVATLGALFGHQIEVLASGRQAQDALEHVLALARRQFDEHSVVSVDDDEGPALHGPRGASAGVVVGPVRTASIEEIDPSQDVIADVSTEWRRVVEAIAVVRRELEQQRVTTLRELGPEEAGIFDAHLALLNDPEILADLKTRVGEGVGANLAWSSCLVDVQRNWEQLADPYLRERAADIRALRHHVLRVLTGAAARGAPLDGVLVARDLTPADAAALDLDRIRGVVLAYGSATSHAAILARARQLPLIVGAGREVLSWPDGAVVAMDGATGELELNPSPTLVETFERRAAVARERRALELHEAHQPATSLDGVPFLVAANLGSLADARSAAAAGADGAGLVRTEFLFLGRSKGPTVEEQEAEYRAMATEMGGRRITLRTLDVGGDKPLPYLPAPREDNPFLGVRGIRLSLRRVSLLRAQLEAIVRTARDTPVSVMFPMISTVEELLEARALLSAAAGDRGLPQDLHVGMMVEVPAAALKIASFVPHLDFVSIGTNDLTQYTLAAERGNAAVAALSDPLDPGVLRLIYAVCRGAGDRIDIALCGEAAGDDEAIPILAGLGVREFSVAPPAVPRVKSVLRRLNVDACAVLARRALDLHSAAQVRQLAASFPAAGAGAA